MATRLIALLAVSFSVLAADPGPDPGQEADWQQRLDKAAALQAEAKSGQSAADERYGRKDAECFRKFLVNACREEAKTEHTTSSREFRRLENQGKALEREVRKEQLLDKDKRRAELAPQREADLRAKEAETAAERQAVEAEQAATRGNKKIKAEEGARRKAAEAEKQQKKCADHEARVAAKMKKAGQPSGEAAKQ